MRYLDIDALVCLVPGDKSRNGDIFDMTEVLNVQFHVISNIRHIE